MEAVKEKKQIYFMKQPKKIVRPISGRRPIGLYIINPIFDQNFQDLWLVPLKSNDFNIKIIDSIAQTTITQVYENTLDKLIEAEFCFPVDNDVVVEKLICEFDGKKIEGVIKEKDQAKKEYQENKEIGNTVVYGEKSEQTPDIMKILVGNILPNSKINVTFVYTQELSVVQNKFLGYRLPQSITPRYDNSNQEQQQTVKEINEKDNTLNNQKYIQENNQNCYTTKISYDIISKNPINFMQSPSHPLLVLYQNDTKSEMRGLVDLQKGENLAEGPNAKDFVLLINQDQCKIPQAILCQNKEKNQYCAKITFVPDFNNVELDDAFKCQLADSQNNNFDVDLEAARSEFVFLLDRSGSMSGSRINKAKEALVMFLKSLPPQCYFNVISFGSTYQKLFENSQQYNEKNLEQAVTQVQNYGANLGGTIIYQPLLDLLKKPNIKNFPRQVFLLTDGCVQNPNQVIELIQQYNKKCRVHSIGIGSGASSYLVNECAKKGKGKPVFIGDQEDVTGQIINLLDTAMTPCLDDFSFNFNKDIVDSMIPAPENIPMIVKNEAFNMYLYFKKDTPLEEIIKQQVQLRCFDSQLNQVLQYTVQVTEIQENMKEFSESIFKLGIHKQIQSLEDTIRFGQSQNNDVYFAQYLGIKGQIQSLSITNQIISSQTAYLCIVNELQDEKRGELLEKGQEKVIVPQIVSETQNNSNKKVNTNYKQHLKKNKSKRMDQNLILGLQQHRMQQHNMYQQQQQQQQYKQQQQQMMMISKPGKHGNPKMIPIQQSVNQQYGMPVDRMVQKSSSNVRSRNSAVIKPQSFKKQDKRSSLRKQESSEDECSDQDDYVDDKFNFDQEFTELPMTSLKNKIQDDNNFENFDYTAKLDSIEKESKEFRKGSRTNSAKIQNQNYNLIDILKQQQFAGFWQIDDGLVNYICGNNSNKFQELLSQVDGNLLFTILLLLWLEKSQQGQKNSWQLIYKKGQSWVKQQKLQNYDEVKQQLNELI